MTFAGDTVGTVLTLSGWVIGLLIAIVAWLTAFTLHWAFKSRLVDEVVKRVKVEDVNGTIDQVKNEEVAESSAASTSAKKAVASQMTCKEWTAQKKRAKKARKQRERAEAKAKDHAAGMLSYSASAECTLHHCQLQASCVACVPRICKR